MNNRDRLLTLAGLLGGVTLALVCMDGILLWQIDAGASRPALLLLAKIGMLITPVPILLGIFIRYRIVGVNRNR